MNKKQVERVSKHYGKLVEEEQLAEQMEQLPQASEAGEQVYAMVDGSMIFTRLGQWKEVKLGRIFSAKSLHLLSSTRNWIKQSVYVAHVGGHEDFLNKFETYTDQYEQDLVFVADGAPWIWNWVEATYSQAVQILDYFHAIEHLIAFALIFFKKGKQKDEWVKAQKELLLSDGVEQVINNIKSLECSSTKAKEEQDKLLKYYQNNRKRMTYKTFKEQGLLIGSGPIESAHRTVVQRRLKLSGQRWTLEGAQNIVNLRVANMSGYWDKVINLIDARKRA
mgnify:FL=1